MVKVMGLVLGLALLSCERTADHILTPNFDQIEYQICPDTTTCEAQFLFKSCFTGLYKHRPVKGTVCWNPKEAYVRLNLDLR